jgi:hypothetical protein
MGHVDHREQWPQPYASTGFFVGFAQRTLTGSFPGFHESSGQRPLTESRLDCSPAQQDFIAPDWNRSYDGTWIDVMHGPALVAAITQTIVAVRNARSGDVTAGRAKSHFGIEKGGHMPALYTLHALSAQYRGETD